MGLSNKKSSKSSKVKQPSDHDLAKAYLIDPLHAPEPYQMTGLGSSHIIPARLWIYQASQQTPKYNCSPRPKLDRIDLLDPMGVYHHSGSYEATLPSSNTNPKTSPLAIFRASR